METRLTPLYSLFGMAPDSMAPGRFHIERVSDRRDIHQEQVEPHRHPHLHQFTYWIAGEGEYRLETDRHAVAAGSLCWVPADHVHGFAVHPQADAIVFSMAREYATQELAAIAQGAGVAILRHPCVISPQDEAGDELAHVFGWAEREYSGSVWGAQDALSALARHALIIVGRHLQKLALVEYKPIAKHELFRRLESCIERRFREHPAVDDIASELGSTPYLLNQASRAATGLRVSHFVRARLMHEARRLLLFTVIDIAEVAVLVE